MSKEGRSLAESGELALLVVDIFICTESVVVVAVLVVLLGRLNIDSDLCEPLLIRLGGTKFLRTRWEVLLL